MRVLVTGAKGQLGFDVLKCLKERSILTIPADIEEFDITDIIAARRFILSNKPDVVIHCSAYTAVDKAEDEQDLSYKINVEGTVNIANICKEIDAKMVYISTDYVFPGIGENFYEVDDLTGPLSVYGLTKLQGEFAVKEIVRRHFIVRISWVFGVNGNNFVKTMLRLGQERDSINVVGDQIGSPTFTGDIAPLLCDMIETEKYGTYHATNEGTCSWAEFAKEIMKLANYSTKINPITTEEYPTKAKRPKNSRLSKESLIKHGFKKLPAWEDALKRYMLVSGTRQLTQIKHDEDK